MRSRSMRRGVDLAFGTWPRRVVVIAMVVGFGLRLWWVLYAARGPVGLHDPFFYLDYARRLSLGGGYRLADGEPTAYYPIGYPAILGLWFRALRATPLGGHWIAGAAGLNLILSTATIGMVAALGRRLLGPSVGALAAVITALFPSLIFHTATILTETTFNFVFVAALLVLCWRPWSPTFPSWRRLVVFGLLLGLSVEIRPIALLVIPMIAIALWRVGARRQALLRSLVVGGLVVAVMIPWTVRNQVVMEEFLPIGTTTGDNLCIGNHPGAQGHFSFPEWCFGHDPKVPRPEFETRRNADLTSISLHWIARHPLEQLRLIAQRTYYTFWHDHDGVQAVQSYGSDPFIPPVNATVLGTLADAYFFAVLAIAALSGSRFATRRDPRRLLLLLSVVAVAISPWAFFGDPRFHIPINVLVPIPAALTIVTMRRDRQRRDPCPSALEPE